MKKLGNFLKELRDNQHLSMRQVEQLAKQLYPKDKKKHISHTYLRKLEDGEYQAPSPFKLKALATIYKTDYATLMKLAEYIEETIDEQKFQKVKNHLNDKGINPDYFFNALLDLGDESATLANRMVSVMAVQERQIRQEVVAENAL